MKPKVSVIVPIYNTEKYLERCIKSLTNQTLEDIEIILINDGSTDGSHNICEKYKNMYPQKIVYLNNQNIGCSATRNLGLEIAHADYIGFVDSDDYVEIDTYEKMYNKMIKENLDLVIVGVNYRKKNGEIIKSKFPKDNSNILDEKKMVMLVWNKLFKKKILNENNIKFIKNSHYQEDGVFSFIYSLYVKKFNIINELKYNYILHGENSVYKIEKRLDVFISYKYLYNYLKSINADSTIYFYFYKLYNLYAIGGSFLLISKKNIIKDSEFKEYKEIFYNKILNDIPIPLFSKCYLFFWYYISTIIRKLNFTESLLKLRRFVRNE